MTSQDDLALLKQMHQRGEISDEQYDVLRRHVLWGTPLPQLVDEVPGAVPAPRADPDVPSYATPQAPRYGAAAPDPAPYGSPGSRQARREAAEDPSGYAASTYRPPAGSLPPPAPTNTYGPPPGSRTPPPAPANTYGPPPGSRTPPPDAATGLGPPPGSRTSPPDAATGYGPPPGSRTPPPDAATGYGPPGSRTPPPDGYEPDGGYFPPAPAGPAGLEPGSRRARREAAEQAPPAAGAFPPAEAPRSRRERRERREEQERTSGDDYSPSAYLPAAPPDDAPRSRRERREAAERSAPTTGFPPPTDHPAPPAHRFPPPSAVAPADSPRSADSVRPGGASPADGFPPVDRAGPLGGGFPSGAGAPADYSRPAYGRAGDSARPASDLPTYPDELEPRRVSRQAEPPPDDDEPRTGRRKRKDGGRPAGARVADQPVKARRRRSLVAVLTSVLLALALAAGGVWWFTLRQAGVLPAEYAKSVCGSVRDWQQAVDSSNSTLVTTIAREQDKTAVRSAVSAFYTSVAGRTDQLRATILDAGVADVAGGQAYSDSLAAAVGTEATDLRGLAARAGRLDPAAAATFQIELQSLLTGSGTAVGNLSSALARRSAGTPAGLRAALSAEPSCAPYVG